MGGESSICGKEASGNPDITGALSNNKVLTEERELRQQIEITNADLQNKNRELQKDLDKQTKDSEEHNKIVSNLKKALEDSEKRLNDLLSSYEKLLKQNFHENNGLNFTD